MDSLLFRRINLYLGKGNPLSTSGAGRFWKPVSGEPSSLTYDQERDLFYWHSKDDAKGGILQWLTKVEGIEYGRAKRLVSAHKDRLVQDNLIRKTPVVDGIKTSPELVRQFYVGGKESKKYWRDRNITDLTIDLYQLGYYDGWYTVPLFVGGQFANFQMRRDIPTKSLAYWYKQNSSYVFNEGILKRVKEVYLTESPIDCLLLIQAGLPAVCTTGGALGWQPKWNAKFSGVERVNIIFDNDSAGVFGAKKVAKNLGEERSFVYTFWDKKKKGYDVDDFIKEGGDVLSLKDKTLLPHFVSWSKYYGF